MLTEFEAYLINSMGDRKYKQPRGDSETIQVPEIPKPLYSLTPPRLAGQSRTKKAITLTDAEKVFKVPDLRRLFREQLDIMWGSKNTEGICGVREDFGKIRIKVYQSIAYYYRPFQRPQAVEKQLLRCTNLWRASKKEKVHDI